MTCIYCGWEDVEETAYDWEMDISHWLCLNCGLAFTDATSAELQDSDECWEYCTCQNCLDNLE